jgi:hypothetical protein
MIKFFNGHTRRALIGAALLAALGAAGITQADNLAGLCSGGDKAAPDAACLAYLEGFLDGALLTDAAIAEHVIEDEHFIDTFTERALRTRVNSSRFIPPATSMADFCLPTDVARQDVVEQLARELEAMPVGESSFAASVYHLVKVRWPCP